MDEIEETAGSPFDLWDSDITDVPIPIETPKQPLTEAEIDQIADLVAEKLKLKCGCEKITTDLAELLKEDNE